MGKVRANQCMHALHANYSTTCTSAVRRHAPVLHLSCTPPTSPKRGDKASTAPFFSSRTFIVSYAGPLPRPRHASAAAERIPLLGRAADPCSRQAGQNAWPASWAGAVCRPRRTGAAGADSAATRAAAAAALSLPSPVKSEPGTSGKAPAAGTARRARLEKPSGSKTPPG